MSLCSDISNITIPRSLYKIPITYLFLILLAAWFSTGYLQNFLQNILLIINFNHVHSDRVTPILSTTTNIQELYTTLPNSPIAGWVQVQPNFGFFWHSLASAKPPEFPSVAYHSYQQVITYHHDACVISSLNNY